MSKTHPNLIYKKNISIRSEEISEILEADPKWIIKLGTTWIFITIIILVSIANFIQYSDVVKTSISITNEYPPINIFANCNGVISDVIINDGAYVNKGDPILILESPASYEDIQILFSELLEFDPASLNSEHFNDKLSNRKLELGKQQIPYIKFVMDMREVRTLYKQKKINYESEHLNLIYNQIRCQDNHLEPSSININTQDLIIKEEWSDSGYSNLKESAYYKGKSCQNCILYKNLTEQNSFSKKANSQIVFGQLIKNQIKLNTELEFRLIKALHELKLSYFNLIDEITKWQDKYVIFANASGKFSYRFILKEHYNIKSNELIGQINQEKRGGIIAKMTVPVEKSNKIRIGQNVKITLEKFPYPEFGLLEGVVESVSGIASEKSYYATVALTNGLKTSLGINILSDQELQGTADVIINEQTVFSKMVALFDFK